MRLRLLGLVVAALCALPAGAHAQHRVVRSAQLDHDGEFRIWNLTGSVRVIGWDVDSVRVDADLDDVAQAFFGFAARGAGGKLTTDRNGRSGIAHLVVRVPRGATVWIKTMSAPVEVTGLTGSIDVYAVTGDVQVDASATTVYAESMGGRVRVTGSARVVRLRTGAGPIEFDGTAADLALTTVSGSILARASRLQRGIVESVDGRVHLGVSLTERATLEMMTHGGVVDLTVPARESARFLLRTVSGTIDVDRALARTGNARDVEFATRGGDADVQIRTFSGAIRLRAAERVRPE